VYVHCCIVLLLPVTTVVVVGRFVRISPTSFGIDVIRRRDNNLDRGWANYIPLVLCLVSAFQPARESFLNIYSKPPKNGILCCLLIASLAHSLFWKARYSTVFVASSEW